MHVTRLRSEWAGRTPREMRCRLRRRTGRRGHTGVVPGLGRHLHLLMLGVVVFVVGCGPSSRVGVGAQQHYERGLELLDQGLYPGAAAEFERCESLGLRSADLCYHKACVQFMLAREKPPDDAVRRELERALAIEPNHVPSLLFLAELYKPPRKGEQGAREALRLYQKVLTLEPNRNELRLDVARWISGGTRFAPASRELLPAGARAGKAPVDSNWPLAIAQQQLEKVLHSSNPLEIRTRAQAHLDLGEVLLRMADYNAAVNHFLLADSLFAQLPEARQYHVQCAWRAGVALYKQGRYQSAANLLNEAARHCAGSLRLLVLWNLRLAADALGDYPDSVPTEFRLELRPELEDPPDTLEGPPFRDVAPELGVAKVGGAGPSAWSDLDGDGRLELFVSGCNTYSALYSYDGERFRNITEASGLGELDWGFSANFVDYDNDGRQDLYIARNGWAGAAANSLLRNEGGGRFRDVTDHAGVACADGSSFVSLSADFDRDGWLDLFVCNGVTGDGSRNVLYHNNHDGTFTDWTERSGLAEPAWPSGTIGAAMGDYDDDVWPDLFVVGRSGAPNRLYHNRGNGSFDEVASAAGVAEAPFNGYMGFLADLDGDGTIDILAVGLAEWDAVIRGLTSAEPLSDEDRRTGPLVYLNNGNGTFRAASAGSGLDVPIGCMGANLGDLDNDGYLDVLFGAGDPDPARIEPLRCFRNLGDGHFTEVTRAWGMWRLGKGHGITLADYDDDGRLDGYVPFGGWWHADTWANALYRNQLPRKNHALFVLLVGTESNKNAIGARLTLRVGGRTLVREVTGPNGFGSTNSYWTHFGLGMATETDALEVTWPSGRRQVFGPLSAEQKYVITEGETQWRRLPQGGRGR